MRLADALLVTALVGVRRPLGSKLEVRSELEIAMLVPCGPYRTRMTSRLHVIRIGRCERSCGVWSENGIDSPRFIGTTIRNTPRMATMVAIEGASPEDDKTGLKATSDPLSLQILSPSYGLLL